MMLTRFVIASASLVTVALAQAKIAFTSVPAEVEAGDKYTIKWGGGNDSPVTLTLRKGDPNDLETIEVLADSVTGTSYEWEVDEDLKDGNDYALQITQGQSDINYSGQFTLSGGSGSSSSGSASGSPTSTSSDNSTSTTSGSSSRTTNGTESSTESSNSTESSTTMESSTTSETSSATTTSESSGSASETGSAQQTSAPDSTSGAMQMGSSIAFALAVLGAVVLMN